MFKGIIVVAIVLSAILGAFGMDIGKKLYAKIVGYGSNTFCKIFVFITTLILSFILYVS